MWLGLWAISDRGNSRWRHWRPWGSVHYPGIPPAGLIIPTYIWFIPSFLNLFCWRSLMLPPVDEPKCIYYNYEGQWLYYWINMMQETFVSFHKGVSPAIQNELNRQSIVIYLDGQWQDKKMDEGCPLIEEWKVKSFLTCSFLITKHTSTSPVSSTKFSTSSFPRSKP